MKTSTIALATVLASIAVTPDAMAQTYSTGPGFYMSLEGRYLQNSGDRTRQAPLDPGSTEKFSDKSRDDKDAGGKATLDYRFPNNWDIGVSASGMKSVR